jgi:alpha-tubulin suppressor-like RCC1 family protein
MKTIKCLMRTRIAASVALAVFGLLSTAAPAATVNAIYNAATDVPVTANGYTAIGNTVNFALNFAPVTGTDLMVVKNTGLAFIVGTFSNLTNGQPVGLGYGGTTYSFVANYYGGSGNDLVLVWAKNRPFAWGENYDGQLGDNTIVDRSLPVPVTATGVLAGKTVVALAAGEYHSLALCSDGIVAAWGDNESGQLGDTTTAQRLVPVAVNTGVGVSALYGKRVVAIAAGFEQSLALCSDGTVAAWGYNSQGELGDNTTTNRNVPVAVNTAPGVSALYGKMVVAIAAGAYHSLALCSDGTVTTWGWNDSGQLGDNTTTNRLAPAAVNTAPGVSALYGKTVVGLAAGDSHSLALCSDATVATWGYNDDGELGDNTTTAHPTPVAVNTASGVSALYSKTVVAIAAGAWHSLALCADGAVAEWGYNYYGELGDNTTTDHNVPVAVNADPGVSALSGKMVVTVAGGAFHSLALCSDGAVAAWGINDSGQFQFTDPQSTNTPRRFYRVRVGQ